MKIIAILRGITPDTAIEVAECLLECGIRTIEVPLNTPGALESIRLLHKWCPVRATIGAGTVLSVAQVDAVAAAGATVVLSPNMNVEVIERAVSLGLTVMPGVATPTEAFRALEAGASALKLFPADVLGTASLMAWRTVLPLKARFIAVGGMDPNSAESFMASGATGVGVGGWLYRSGLGLDQIRLSAIELASRLARFPDPADR